MRENTVVLDRWKAAQFTITVLIVVSRKVEKEYSLRQNTINSILNTLRCWHDIQVEIADNSQRTGMN